MGRIRLPPLPTIRDLVRLYRLTAIKQLSQNFLMDERLTDKIVKSSGRLKDAYVCEVGPGPGGITRSILKRQPKKLIVVEKDPRFLPTLELLAEATTTTDMQIEIGDILTFDLNAAFKEAPICHWEDDPPPIHLIGNLPFSVSTHLIIKWLESISKKDSIWSRGRVCMTLTFQKEVAERICAPIAHQQRCRLSIMSQLFCEVNHKFTIAGQAFVPKPDVDVGVVTFTPVKQPKINLPFKLIEKVVRQVFHMRQKYCVRGAETLFPQVLRVELASKMCALADVNPKLRPFQLSIDEFVRLCYAYNELCKDYQELDKYDYRAPKQQQISLQL